MVMSENKIAPETVDFMPDHIADKLCSCRFCTMIDVMFGDPLLNEWEKKFIESVARQGWLYDYTPKQKTKLLKIFHRQWARYAHCD